MVDDMHVPCSPGAPGAMAMVLQDVPSDKLQEPIMTAHDFEAVLGNARPTVTESDLEPYIKWTEEYGSEGGAVPGGGRGENAGIDPAANPSNPTVDSGTVLRTLIAANNKLTAVMVAALESNALLAHRVAQLEAESGGTTSVRRGDPGAGGIGGLPQPAPSAIPSAPLPGYQAAFPSNTGYPPVGALPPSGGSGSPPVDPQLEARLRALRGE